jgi:hypothetical protein
VCLAAMFRRSPFSYGRYRRSIAKVCYAVFLVIAIAIWNLCDTILDPVRPSPGTASRSFMTGEKAATNDDFAVRLSLVPASNVDAVSSESHHQTIRSLNFVRVDRPQAAIGSTSHTYDYDQSEVEVHVKTEHRNDGYTYLPSSRSRVTRKNVQNVMEEERKQAGDDTTLPVRNMPVEQELRDTTEKEGLPEATGPLDDMPVDNYRFPSQDECESLKEKADVLSDMLMIPFEDVVRDMALEGWEDEWISKARYTGPRLNEPKIDFVYNCMYTCMMSRAELMLFAGVNGSQTELLATMRPYEVKSPLNDEDGIWLASHGSNRYREWNELRYSLRSVEKYAGTFLNRIQILVNAYENRSSDGGTLTSMGKQQPHWLKENLTNVQVLSQEDFFGADASKCLPTFDSLTIENQLYNTKSNTDRLFALSDDMILGKPHAASDLYSPLFGPTLGFKDNAYNTLRPPTEEDAERFGEKPFLIYTSWLLNRRFGARKRKGQAHFGHSISRSVAREAITSFPGPALHSASQRFRGETGFQLYSWYVIFHYTMERHRETLLYSYVMMRSDSDEDGYLGWSERKRILRDVEEGMSNESTEVFRRRIYYNVGDHLEEAGLEPPTVNTDILWTSMDGPAMIKDLDCDTFDAEECLGPGFSTEVSDSRAHSPVFSTAAIFDRVARESPRCGDCLIKLVLNRRRSGLGSLLPHPTKQRANRETIVKALMRYQYMIVQPDAAFHMVTDAQQAEHTLLRPYLNHGKKVGQICLNDDIETQEEGELEAVSEVMTRLFEGLLPEKSKFEK